MTKFLLSVILFFFGQVLIWYQTNGQFKWKWFADHPFLVACLFSIPISYAFILATKLVVGHFDGALWPGRLIGFATGMISFAILTSIYMGESITPKTAVSLILAITLVSIQILWK